VATPSAQRRGETNDQDFQDFVFDRRPLALHAHDAVAEVEEEVDALVDIRPETPIPSSIASCAVFGDGALFGSLSAR
jgi:hypothetical protein